MRDAAVSLRPPKDVIDGKDKLNLQRTRRRDQRINTELGEKVKEKKEITALKSKCAELERSRNEIETRYEAAKIELRRLEDRVVVLEEELSKSQQS